MSSVPFLLGGGALAAYVLSNARPRDVPVSATGKLSETPPAGVWVWPVAAWNGRVPVVSDGFRSPRPGGRHGGVDIMFERRSADPFRAGTPNGSRMFVMPDGIHALAAADGEVWSAMKTSHGYAVVIQHEPLPFRTFYTHLERLLVAPAAPNANRKQRVRAGEPIGLIGYSPRDPAKLKHLHFELWRSSPSDKLDPELAMAAWPVVGAPRLVRNGGFVYRPVGASRERYPQWVRDLKGESGVYIIRERDSREIVYVGSSVGRLYDTLTRHFQVVRHEAQEVPMT